jgi:hypothetical protein
MAKNRFTATGIVFLAASLFDIFLTCDQVLFISLNHPNFAGVAIHNTVNKPI